MLSVLNVATPATAGTVFVPESVPPPGFTAMAIVTLLVKLVTVFPWASLTATVIGASGVVDVVVTGCEVKTSWDAAPAVMLNGRLVADVSPVGVAVALRV